LVIENATSTTSSRTHTIMRTYFIADPAPLLRRAPRRC
jgi:hypothetical protein